MRTEVSMRGAAMCLVAAISTNATAQVVSVSPPTNLARNDDPCHAERAAEDAVRALVKDKEWNQQTAAAVNQAELTVSQCFQRVMAAEKAEKERWRSVRESEMRERAAEAGRRRIAENDERQRQTVDAERIKTIAESLKSNRKVMRLAFGAIFCEWNAKRDAVKREIAEQKKYARATGVVDKNIMYALGLQLRNAEEAIAEERENLRDYRGVIPASCRDAGVLATIACHNHATSCSDDRQRALAFFVPDVNERDRMDEVAGRVPGIRVHIDDPDRFSMPVVPMGDQ